MKKSFTYNPRLLSLVSAVVTIVFITLAVGSIGEKTMRVDRTYDKETGIFSEKIYQKYEKDGKKDWYLAEVKEGEKNRQGHWTGVTKTTYYDTRGGITERVYVEFREAVLVKWGDRFVYEASPAEIRRLLTISGDDTIYHRTDRYAGNIHIGKIEKSARIGANELSAWQILDNEYPWFLHRMNGHGYSNEELKALTDTIETLLALEEIDYIWNFEDYYDDIIYELESITPYDEILEENEIVIEQLALENASYDPFRMAVVDYYLSPEKTIYEIVKNDYYSYYRSNFDRDGKREHFERFCSDIQDSLKNYPPVGISDPFLADSVDSYLYTILYTIVMGDDDDDEFSDNMNAVFLKSGSLSSIPELRSKSDLPSVLKNITAGKLFGYLRKSDSSIFTKHASDSEYNIKSFANSIVLDVYFRAYEKTDILLEAIEKAWLLRNGHATEPVVVILQAENLTDTSIEITGLVTWDGGDPVTSRGIVWADYYEPTIKDNEIKAGAGTGEFKVTISGLEIGKTFYARGYAANSEGIVYGNNVKFSASLPSGIDETAGNLKEFLIFPNPAKERATVSFSLESQERVTLQITDLAGREVLIKGNEPFPQGAHQMNLDLTSLRSGIYFCRLITDTEVMEQKIIVSR